MAVSMFLSAVVAWGFVRVARTVTAAEVLVPIRWRSRCCGRSGASVCPAAGPFYFYFVKGLTLSLSLPVARVALLTVIGLNLYDHAGCIVPHDQNRSASTDRQIRGARNIP
jgi:hypothetical protein